MARKNDLHGFSIPPIGQLGPVSARSAGRLSEDLGAADLPQFDDLRSHTLPVRRDPRVAINQAIILRL